MIPNAPETLTIQNLQPQLDHGRYAVKRALGEELIVRADIFKEGHDLVTAVLKFRPVGAKAWRETPMRPLENDRWEGGFIVDEPGTWEFTVEAWGDSFRSWQKEVSQKFAGGIRDLASEALEGAALLRQAAKRAGKSAEARKLRTIATRLKSADAEGTQSEAGSPKLSALMAAWPDRSLSTTPERTLPLWVDRKRAAVGAWYEFFPRSAEGHPDRGSTFRGCLGRIDDAKKMGFDVIYFPPIHPIGVTNRKGRNNAVSCQPGEPGVPYAIGNHLQGVNGGGHKDIAPELGTLEDFDWLVAEVKKRGMEIALDFAINCSPDHPYVQTHPEWFYKRPDGSIKYAENPPKKYEDVYPLNFHNPDWKALWQEMRDVIAFWCSHQVRIFRVDNPHTKPVSFWEWLIADIQQSYPDAIFLSEAFTRPKMMQTLAKAGFSQSYTYFTWRNSKAELTEYLTELTQTEMKEYFRANFFTNTPDILPRMLQQSGRPGFVIRALLAATLSPVYGIYSGFELCENTPIPGREEYLDSEKYQFKGRDWNAEGNIKETLTRLNAIRRDNPALQEYRNLRFQNVENDNILFFSKATASRDNVILVAISLDPFNPQTGFVHVPLWDLDMDGGETYQVEDLLSGERFLWTGERNYIALDPQSRPAHILRVRRWV